MPNAFLCMTCGTQYPPADPPGGCAICLDERQYVPLEGQRWTTLGELRRAHRSRLEEEEPGLLAAGTSPGGRCASGTTARRGAACCSQGTSSR